jgi:non-specific serine/threonine protein kinase
MGVVFKAHDPRLNRAVAIKLLRPGGYLNSDERHRRLLIEARAAAALDHPSIATVYEIGETDDGDIFLAMAFYDGETLEARLARGPLPTSDALRIALEIARGVSAAHAGGITHRDLKPSNVMLTRAGSVKLLDFGIARVAGVDETTGAAIGTIAYMSPEQLRGEPADSRADVWAFGAVLREMLTGEGGSDTDPASLADSSTIRVGLAAIVQRALSEPLNDRFEDGTQLVTALSQLVPHQLYGVPNERIVHVPAPVSTVFGREREVADISRRLALGRLLTLTGPGGIGKTRLAQQVAWDLQNDYEDGVVFVSLAAVVDPDLVCRDIGRILGIVDRPTMSSVQVLTTFLAHRRMLLVLDNFEHVMAAAPQLSLVLSECAYVRVLVTSRVSLKLAGEQEYAILPLPLPSRATTNAVTDLEIFPGTALFLDRVRAVCHGLIITDDQARAIIEICYRLDGLPLALELAAARAKLFSPCAMLTRLDRRLEWSAGGDRPARHHSLRDAIGWSYDLLRPDEQALFRMLSIFAGGGDLDDITAVVRVLVPGLSDVFDRCEALIDHNLVIREDARDGAPRLRMLDTIREFALERLRAADEWRLTCRAHALRFLALAEEAHVHLTGPDQSTWFDRLEVQHENLRAALTWAEMESERDIAMRFGSALWRFWVTRGHLREGRDRIDRMLHMPGADQPTLLRARVLHGAATLTHEMSDYRAARQLADESLAIARLYGDQPLTAMALNNVGWLLVRMGELTGGEAFCEEALALNRQLGDRRGVAIALHNLGWSAASRGDYDRACTFNAESLEWRRRHGDPRGIAFAMTDLGWTEMGRGALNRASELLDAARSMLEPLQDRQILAWNLATQGLLERIAGRPVEALHRLEMSIRHWRQVGNDFGLGFSLVGHAEAALDLHDRECASRDLEEAIPLLRHSGVCRGIGDALKARGRLAELQGDPQGARAYYAESLAVYVRLTDARAIAECQAELARLERTPNR